MTDHKTAFVPIETWAYASPSLRNEGKAIDIGLFAEALIYYDCVIVNLSNQPQFAQFIQWFIKQNKLDDFYKLLKEGNLKFYEYSFISTPVEKENTYIILNIQDEH